MDWKQWADDKTQVITAVVILTIAAMVMMPDQVGQYFDAALSGLFGIAIGAKLKSP